MGSGTGLGLALVREIATAHGGAVTCNSHPDKGSVFRLMLPVWKDVANPRDTGSNAEIGRQDPKS